MKKVRLKIDGVLLLDKPAGLSSNDVLVRAKRLLNAEKVGHTGTLDPFATGLLPLCFGEATKFAQDLLEADKTYEAVLHLGIRTDTGDTEGNVLSQCRPDVSEALFRSILPRFTGEILQTPPMYSALKRDGKPLYEYARAGITLEREARPVTIRALELIRFDAPYAHVAVTCSKGTYIRVLAEDIGNALGCGAHLNALRRTAVGPLRLSENRVQTLESMQEIPAEARLAALAPVDALLQTFPPVVLPEALAQRFLQGQRLALGKENLALPSSHGRVRVYVQAAPQAAVRLLGTAQLASYGVLAPERLVAAAATRDQ